MLNIGLDRGEVDGGDDVAWEGEEIRSLSWPGPAPPGPGQA